MADDEKPADPTPDPLIEAFATAIMEHAAPNGAADYPRVAAAFAQILAEMIGPQPDVIRTAMEGNFRLTLHGAINLAALRASVIKEAKQ